MKKRTILAVALAVVFSLAVAAPVFSQSMSHTVDYNLNGTIELNKTVGHFCNTGAEMKQVISGQGQLTKSSDIYMVQGYLAVDDANDFVTAPDAIRNLTVTTSIKLCAPAKYVDDNDEVQFPYNGPDSNGAIGEQNLTGLTALTNQIWAASVSADPGFSGQLNTAFTAAYGPYENDPDGEGWYWDSEGALKSGVDYVGNFFEIEQFARTSQGTTKRYIDISSPWSHAFLHEDMTVVGMAEIRESFEMMNISPGSESVTDWWDLF